MVRETELTPSHLVQPLFVQLGEGDRTPIEAMPGVERLSISQAVEEAGAVHALGIPAVLLFGLPAEKDEQASGAYDDEGVVQLAVRALKEAHPELVVITDVCLCAYPSHGHCGVVLEDGTIDNDLSLELLAKTAISHAAAGADAVAPSDMMDGRIGAIRHQLDEEGHSEVPIVAYSAKEATDAPVAAYHVSGEYSMLKAAAANGWLDERAAALESLVAIRRAGADVVVTYFAK